VFNYLFVYRMSTFHADQVRMFVQKYSLCATWER